MILTWMIIIPLMGGLAAWFLSTKHSDWARWISLASLGLDVFLLLYLWQAHSADAGLGRSMWFIEYNRPWIPQLGISLHLAIDGLSLVLVALTLFLLPRCKGVMAAALWALKAEGSEKL